MKVRQQEVISAGSGMKGQHSTAFPIPWVVKPNWTFFWKWLFRHFSGKSFSIQCLFYTAVVIISFLLFFAF